MHTPLLLSIALAAPGGPRQDPSTDALELLPPAEVSAALEGLAADHPDVARLVEVGTSRAGRPIRAVELAGPDASAAPAILVVANLEGPRALATRVALHCAEDLARRYDAGDDEVRAFLDSTALFVLPAPNPDGLARRWELPSTPHVGQGHDVDDDRDGRVGEDPPADVDGDGFVLHMRVPDPEGGWLAWEDDPRANVEADRTRGERGVWRIVPEGRDLDGDGEVAEDPSGDTHLAAQFPAGWEEHEPRSGLFPLDEPEARALADFVIAHPEIALVLTWGDLDNLAAKRGTVKDDERPVKRIPPSGILESDDAWIAALAEDHARLTGVEERESPSDAGSFPRWAYEHRGLWSLSAILWVMPTEAPETDDAEAPAAEEEEAAGEEPAEEEPAAGDPGAGGGAAPTAPAATEAPADRPQGARGGKASKEREAPDAAGHLAWIDASGEGDRFHPWTSFEHPELGPVEIGGLAPHTLREPPASERRPIAEARTAFVLSLGPRLARLGVPSFTAESLGGGLWRVEAAVENTGFLPLLTRAGRRASTPRPARVDLRLPAGAALLGGEARALLRDLEGSGGRQELSWLVRADDPAGLALEVDSDHAGRVEVSVEVIR